MDQEPHQGDEKQHRRGKRIDAKGEVDADVAGSDPAEHLLDHGLAVLPGVLDEDPQGGQQGERDGAHPDERRLSVAETPGAGQEHHGAGEREGGDEPE